MDELMPYEFGNKSLPPALQDVGITVVNLEPYMAVLSLVTDSKRADMTIERASTSYILHALADFLSADLNELRQKGN